MSEWRDVNATRPKSGEDVIVKGSFYSPATFLDGTFCCYQADPSRQQDHAESLDSENLWFKITHWMPHPQCPIEE